MYHLPKEIIEYIYQFDSTSKTNYNNVIYELNTLHDEYNNFYYNNTHIIKQIVRCGYPQIKNSMHLKWLNTYGIKYNPGYYILNRNKDLENDKNLSK